MIAISAARAAKLKTSIRSVWWIAIRNGNYFPNLKLWHIYPTGALPSGATFSSFAVNYEGLMNSSSIRDVSSKVNHRKFGGVAPAGRMSFRISNHDNWYSQLEAAGVTYEGLDVQLFHNDGENTTMGDDPVLWSGHITVVDPGAEWIEFEAETHEDRYAGLAPPRTYDPADSSVWAVDQIKEAVRGKPIPMVWGAVDQAAGFTLSDTYYAGGDKGRFVQFVDVGWPSCPGVKSIEDVLYGAEGLREATGGFASINAASGKSEWTGMESLGGVYFESLQPENLYMKLFIKMRSWCQAQSGTSGVTSQKNAIDEDTDTYAYVPPATDATADPRRNTMFKVPAVGIDGTIEGSQYDQKIYLVAYLAPELDVAKWDYYWDVAPYNMRVWGAYVTGAAGATANGFGFYNPCYISGDRFPINNWNWPAEWEYYQLKGEAAVGAPTQINYNALSDIATWFFGCGVLTTDGTNASGYLRVYQAALRVHCYIDWPAEGFYASINGYKDTAAGAITGTADLLIENPAHIVSALWYWIGGASGNMSTSDHKTIAATMADYKFGRQLVERDTVVDVIDQLCSEAGLWATTSNTGAITLSTMAAVGAAVGVFELGEAEVVGKNLTSRKLSPAEDVVTDFVFRYRPNPVTDDYSRSIHCNADGSSTGLGSDYEALCEAGRDDSRAGVERAEEFVFDWIRDDDTMLAVAKRIIAMKSRRLWEVTWEADIALMALEVGDPMLFVRWEWDGLPRSILAGKYRIASKRINPSRDRITFLAAQVYDST